MPSTPKPSTTMRWTDWWVPPRPGQCHTLRWDQWEHEAATRGRYLVISIAVPQVSHADAEDVAQNVVMDVMRQLGVRSRDWTFVPSNEEQHWFTVAPPLSADIAHRRQAVFAYWYGGFVVLKTKHALIEHRQRASRYAKWSALLDAADSLSVSSNAPVTAFEAIDPSAPWDERFDRFVEDLPDDDQILVHLLRRQVPYKAIALALDTKGKDPESRLRNALWRLKKGFVKRSLQRNWITAQQAIRCGLISIEEASSHGWLSGNPLRREQDGGLDHAH